MTDLLLQIIFLPLLAYFLLSTAYLLVLAIAGRWPGQHISPLTLENHFNKITILIPSFREDKIIIDTARRTIGHDYPAERFQVIVVADQLNLSTIVALRQLPVNVIEVAFDVSMKAKSIHAGLQALQAPIPDIVVILDADNVMAPGCLRKINTAFNAGEAAVQCHRVAKNKNTAISLLDGISEEINVNLFRRGTARLGLSAAPMGSGMAFRFALLQEIFSVQRILDEPGEDREIDFQLMKKKVRMVFLDDALVYDEKVDNTGSFGRQRLRWMEAQLSHLRRFFLPEMRQVVKGADFYHKLVQTMLLPRLLYLVSFAAIALALLAAWTFGWRLLPFHPAWWLGCIFGYLLVLLVSIPTRFYNLQTVKALTQIPVLAVSMISAIFKMRRNRKVFLHTEKSVVNK